MIKTTTKTTTTKRYEFKQHQSKQTQKYIWQLKSINMPNKNDAPKASGQPLAKTASSPTALNVVTKRTTPTPSALSPLARHSQLSDSGAESCGDGDEQRLIRHPSMRPHKYIIIPATPSSPGASGTSPPQLPFRQTNSTTSLVAMAAAMHKQPPRQASLIKSRPNSDVIQPAQLQQQQHLQLPQPQPATSTSTVTFTIDDCEPAAPAVVAAPPTAAHYTPTTLTCTTTTTMATANDGLMSPLSYDTRNRLGSHHSSMRSVVSGKLRTTASTTTIYVIYLHLLHSLFARP